MLAKAMRDFHQVRWAPTFAFIDQQAAEVEWATIEQLAGFRFAKYPKAELWLLFGTSFLPRGLRVRQDRLDEQFADRVTALYGTPLWRPVVEAYRAGRLAAVDLRDELVNLMRYRLEHVLGYRWTHPFIMKNTRGQDLYCMIFATDHPAGDRIMANLYGTALDRHEQMRQDAALRVKFKKTEEANRKAQQDALFPVEIKQVRAAEFHSNRVYVHQPAWRPGWLPDRIP